MIFPALKPSSRSFRPGDVPVTVFRSLSGKETRIVTGSQPSAHGVRIGYQNVTEAAASSILAHWYAMQGTALAFTLPPEIWAGWTEYLAGASANQYWRYSQSPEIKAVSPSIMGISVQLVSVLDG